MQKSEPLRTFDDQKKSLSSEISLTNFFEKWLNETKTTLPETFASTEHDRTYNFETISSIIEDLPICLSDNTTNDLAIRFLSYFPSFFNLKILAEFVAENVK